MTRTSSIRSLVVRPFRIGLLTPGERKNMVTATIEGCLVVAAVQILAAFTPVYVMRLGGNLQQVGLLTSFPFLLNAAVLALSAAVSVSARRALRLSLAAAVAHRILMVILPLAPFFGPASTWWVIAVYSVASAAMSLSATYWTAAVSDMFSPDKRGRVFGIRNVFTGAAGFLATFSGGLLLDAFAFPANFSITFWAATALGVSGAFFLARLDPPGEPEIDGPGASTSEGPAQPESAPARPAGRPHPGAPAWHEVFHGSAARALMSVAIPLAMFNIGFHWLTPVVNVYFIETLGFSNSVIGVLTSAFVLSQVAGSLVWGALIDRWGNNLVAFVTTAGMALQSLVFWLSPSVVFLLVVQAFGGFCFAGVILGSFNMAISAGDRRLRSQTVTWVNTFSHFSAFVGPLLGATTLTAIGYVSSFLLATAFRALGSLLYLWSARGELARLRSERNARRSRPGGGLLPRRGRRLLTGKGRAIPGRSGSVVAPSPDGGAVGP